EIQDNEIINISINQKVEIDLQSSNIIEDWKDYRRSKVVNYEFLEREFDRLEDFLKQERKENKPSPFQFFFSYLRRNIDLVDNTEYEDIKFYEKIFQDYSRKYTEYKDEILETIRIITKIFYQVKNYKSLLDYKHYFKEFKESGEIETELSLRKFTENMQWIKTSSNIAPSYYVNWPALNIISSICFMKFHPQIEVSIIRKIVTQIPFFFSSYFSRYSFGMEVRGYFLAPKVYISDVSNFLQKLKNDGILVDIKFFNISRPQYTTNLNYFREISKSQKLINPTRKDYKQEYHIDFKFEYGYNSLKSPLTLLDWLLIDRIRYYSVTGLGFERKSETIKDLKDDLLNEIQSQRRLIDLVKRNLDKVQNSKNDRDKLLELIENNKNLGFFYIKEIISQYVSSLDLISSFLETNPNISNLFQLNEFIKNQGISKSIENNNLLLNVKKVIFNEFMPLFFSSKKAFKELTIQLRLFNNLLKTFYDLKIFSLESIKSIINDNSLINKIYQSKEEKLKKSYESFKIYKITNQTIEQRLEVFLNKKPPIIHPSLLETFVIAHLTSYYPTVILKYNPKNIQDIDRIKWIFPRVVYGEIIEYKSHEKYIYLQLQISDINLKEKYSLFSILHTFFQNNIINLKSYYMSGFQEAFSIKDFYDLDKQDFFYTKDLFKHFHFYVKHILKGSIQPIKELKSNITTKFWGKQPTISYLSNQIENRISKEHIEFNLSNLNRLIKYNNILKKVLLDKEEFKNYKTENFFINHIKTIKIIPSFQSFGFGQYFLYFYPLDLNEIDFKQLLSNTFQKLKFPANIDNSNSFFIQFICPYRNPNTSLLNWLTKSKKVIREYCLFFIKKVFPIFHFNHNLSVNEWDLDPDRFKIYFQNILFNPDYKIINPELKEINVGALNTSNYLIPNSQEFKALTYIYSWKSIDIKTYLGTRKYNIVNSINELLKKNLIFPIISIKNLDLIERLYIILPNVKQKYNEKLINILSFFNVGFIYEIEGEYFIHGMQEEIKFENGFLIKLYLPDCQLDEFERLFDLIFEYLGVKHYVILNDLVDGKNFLKSIYGNLDFLNDYNPLKNLIWNDKDKIWMNHKLFNEKFEKIYPDLNPNKKS
ncbi:MAG: hypothetical protein ACFFEY_16525, partial [Candidatus Thorarchaeota archaeon]